MTHMLKAEKQLTANRLCRGSGISKHNGGRAAQQTDPVTRGTLGLWERYCPQHPPHPWSLPADGRVVCPTPLAQKGRGRVGGIIPPPCGCSLPLHWRRDPLHTQPSLAFGLKPWQFV